MCCYTSRVAAKEVSQMSEAVASADIPVNKEMTGELLPHCRCQIDQIVGEETENRDYYWQL